MFFFSAVHLVGGASALVATWMLGPRLGKKIAKALEKGVLFTVVQIHR